MPEKGNLDSTAKGTHEGGGVCNNPEGGEEPEAHKKRKKTKKSKKHRRNREMGDEESRRSKRRKIDRQESGVNVRDYDSRELAADKLAEEKQREQRQRFMSKLNEQPTGRQSSLFRRAMLRLHQHGPGTDLLEALEKTIDEENT
ncbi:uncharacterized protein ColSpa_02095 [Colletotrichum spaethianum]|uniref:Uncharacterized protein n=1 Tax=Colletotrichum spaethianum TaxID=700344 RepID=A0AA37P740_9PEZI|nr:uncharacterized protein ColSpa_02095 [Colletotrichum spaethianum]GKT41914.1 hypothetical protein ColSpa_02095 [Colletotrichum spaethianum]